MPEPWLLALGALLGGYLLGSIPFGLIVTRLAGGGDLRAVGSGNIGATNVLRTGRRDLAVLTLLLDGGKGAAAAVLGALLAPGLGPVAGVGAFFGHLFPVWLHFRGGKGVATLLGIALALHGPTGLVGAGVWLLAVLATRMSSVGGLAMAVSLPVAATAFGEIALVPMLLALALLVCWTHRANIGRLLAGTEPRLGRGAS